MVDGTRDLARVLCWESLSTAVTKSPADGRPCPPRQPVDSRDPRFDTGETLRAVFDIVIELMTSPLRSGTAMVSRPSMVCPNTV